MSLIPDGNGGRDGAAQQCFVRFLRQRTNGYVEFVFSIGDPALGVELILPRQAYDGFCLDNQVQFIGEAQARQLDVDAQKWRYGIPGIHE